MCLVVLERCHPTLQPLIAEEDITCYKVLEEMDDGSLRTPYREVIISNNVLSSECFQNVPTKIQDEDFAIYKNDFHTSNFRIEKGIHSFKTLETAKEEIFILNTCLQGAEFYIVKEAIIPKGVKYWVGQNNEYCSEKIIFKDL